MEMTTYAIGTDHHQRAHRIAGRALELALGQQSTLAGFRLELGADPVPDSAQLPSSAETSSPPAAAGQPGRFQRGPCAVFATAARSSFNCAKNSRHEGSSEAGSRR